MDGVGLGPPDALSNPFANAKMPNLTSLLGGRRLLLDSVPFDSHRATLIALDTTLSIAGLPQSATGQSTLLTGVNAPAKRGEHYGPKPDPQIADLLANNNLFKAVLKNGGCAAFLNAYPPRYFSGIQSGRRLPGAMAMAALQAGITLRDEKDLFEGRALSADLTGHAWRTILGFPETPLITPYQAGSLMAKLAQACDFSLFEYWVSDLAGHRQEMNEAIRLIETFDEALGGLLDAWDDRMGMIVITSDHGNLEDLSTRRHTYNPVPCLLVGQPRARSRFAQGLNDLTGIAPAVLRTLEEPIDPLLQ